MLIRLLAMVQQGSLLGRPMLQPTHPFPRDPAHAA